MNQIKIILFLSFLYSIVSCEQNPLKGVPEELQEGVLETGEPYLDLFDHYLYPKMIQVNIKGGQSGRDCQTVQDGKTIENCLRLEFYEGEENSYTIRIRPTNNVEKRYNLTLDTTAFSYLERQGLTVTQKMDKNKKDINITWKPSKTFTNNQTAKIESLDLIVNGNDKLKTKPPFKISRRIDIVVYKILDPPEIYKISTKYDNYEKLDDGQFYTKHRATTLNLDYYDRLFFGKKQDRTDESKKGKEIFSYLKFYSKFHNKYHTLIRSFDVHDQYDQSVPYKLLSYLKQNVYMEKDPGEGEDHCARLSSKNGKCIIPVQTEDYSTIDFNSPIYVKRYQIPESIELKALFYKVEDSILCEAYKNIRSAKESNINNQAVEAPCYLPVSQVYSSNGLEEKEDVYLLKEDKSSGEKNFELINKSHWSFYFYKIPESVKWLLGGALAVSVPIHLLRGSENEIDFFVKGYNFDRPQLLPFQDDKESVFWWRDMKHKSTQPIEGEKNRWKITYSLKMDEDSISHSFDQFSGNLKPYSSGKQGLKASFSFNLLLK